MKPSNLISVYEGNEALLSINEPIDGPLKTHEIHCLHTFCDALIEAGCTVSDFESFFVGYIIHQIGKEFDLLKFDKEAILNIELKSELNPEDKEEKILKQMRTNQYYLNAAGRRLIIITYVEEDGFYRYSPESSTMTRITPVQTAIILKHTHYDPDFDPDEEFIPSNYLISPFNGPDKFINDQYFLTTAQNAIKKEIMSEYEDHSALFFTLCANTGTGKTLLIYDLAKELMKQDIHVSILQSQDLNTGQKELTHTYHWHIYSLQNTSLQELFEQSSFIMIDEAQQLSQQQVLDILSLSTNTNIPVLFSYDQKQETFHNQSFDIVNLIQQNYPNISLSQKRLTNKIRTNKEMAAFIDSLMEINPYRSHDHTYENVTIDYINTIAELEQYILTLQQEQWDVITFKGLSQRDLTGQEYKKGALILDQSFYYRSNQLHSKNGQEELLYEIVTRIIYELKIVVLNNPDLYAKLLEIKNHK